MFFLLLLYNLIFPIVFILYLPFYLVHILRRGGLTVDYWQRVGLFTPSRARALRALSSPVWIHAVSVGEAIAAASFIQAWRQRHPDVTIVLSCGTATGFATARKKLPAGVEVIYSPLDLYPAVRRTFALLRPRLLVIFEVEIWPNLILQGARHGCQVVLVNGRISDRSGRGYARWRRIFRPIFGAFSALCVQTEADAERIATILGDRRHITVCDTMKFDQTPDMAGADKSAELAACFGPGPHLIFTAGSTHAGEEELVCAAVAALRPRHPELKLVLVPRHAERAAAVAAVVAAQGLRCALLQRPEGVEAMAGADVLLVNTTGELMHYYAVSDIAYVGKSLAGQTGGHNIIEPAIFGKPILYGRHMENFRAVAALFREHEAGIELGVESELLPQLERLVEDAGVRAELGRRARAVVDRYRGAIGRTLDILDTLA